MMCDHYIRAFVSQRSECVICVGSSPLLSSQYSYNKNSVILVVETVKTRPGVFTKTYE